MANLERIALIESRLRNALHPEFLEVVDESDQHIGHAGHAGGGRHFAIHISADSLKGLSKVEAHRQIYSLFSDLMPNVIHALRIHVK